MPYPDEMSIREAVNVLLNWAMDKHGIRIDLIEASYLSFGTVADPDKVIVHDVRIEASLVLPTVRA